ncbi:uncharacterized protein VTP21DRAFT_2760 [Calcarisporiella thermophila]|uniref:uncharacterized protein n=1 Tax=Calcarisporiella thermophila TaxID=911321 RepID=UPI0037423CF6
MSPTSASNLESLESTVPHNGDEVMSPDGLEVEEASLVSEICGLDGGLNLLLNQAKLSSLASKDVIVFLRKRAIVEEEYGKNLLKVAQNTLDTAERSEYYKRGTFSDSWMEIVKLHQKIAEQRIKFAQNILDVSEELNAILKETDRMRKQLKENGQRQERLMQESEQALEKARHKYETMSGDWERTILQRSNTPINLVPQRMGSPAIGSNAMLSGSPSTRRTLSKPINIFKQARQMSTKIEEDARIRASLSNENYKAQLYQTNQARQEYFSVQLPRIVTSLLETVDECNLGMQYQLARYSFIYERALASEGKLLDDDSGNGLRSLVESINHSMDLRECVRNTAAKHGKLTHVDIPYAEYLMSQKALSIIHPKPIFGIDLALQLERDNLEVPTVLVKCAYAVEKHGILNQGIYRISGTSTEMQKLKQLFDRDAASVDLDNEKCTADINNVAGVLKSYFRELPDPLFTKRMYSDFVNASKIEDESLRLVTMHETVNALPDPNYATLKYLMCHLDRVQAHQQHNKMSVANLAIVWGPTLMTASSAEEMILIDMPSQCKVVEIILENYKAIFEEEEEEIELARKEQ